MWRIDAPAFVPAKFAAPSALNSSVRVQVFEEFEPQLVQKTKNCQNTRQRIFNEYISEEEAVLGCKYGPMFTGVLRVNSKNYKECFVENPKGGDHQDVIILGNDRNRAMTGDMVTIKMKPRVEWLINTPEYLKWWSLNNKENDSNTELDTKTEKRTLQDEMKENGVMSHEVPDNCLISVGAVVRINEKKHVRLAAGKLQMMTNTANPNVLFVPVDSRVPRMLIPKHQVALEFFARPKDFEGILYTAKIVDWREDSIYADGQLVEQLGVSGEIETETERILQEFQIDTREFNEECFDSLPIMDEGTWKIPNEELQSRSDFRGEIVFTIDPKTARDLDDALHINHIPDCDGYGAPGYEVGVHIADVSHFLKEGTELDKWASERGNSTYLTQKVIPMLPNILCEQLCSLNPGVDRLAFSVVFRMNYDADIKYVWFGKTIIRSRVKLAYEDAQKFIENPQKEFKIFELPAISDGCTPAEIKEKTLMLHGIAQILRARRENEGCLTMEQPKMKFELDENGRPQAVMVHEMKDANKMIEEFMLLANMEVAKKIQSVFPDHALLRSHPPPKAKMLLKAAEKCEKFGFALDGETADFLASSFQKYQGTSKLEAYIRQVISSLTVKPMQQARYMCTYETDPKDFRHFGLNVNHYTHFTSPIRRYADVIVHRLLAIALGYNEDFTKTPDEIKKICQRCNEKKAASEGAADSSINLYFGAYIRQIGNFKCRAVVVKVLDSAFDVLLVNYGVVKRVYVDKLERNFDKQSEKLTIEWPADQNAEIGNESPFLSTIQTCSVIDVVLVPLNEISYSATMLRPNRAQRQQLEYTLTEMWESGLQILEY